MFRSLQMASLMIVLIVAIVQINFGDPIPVSGESCERWEHLEEVSNCPRNKAEWEEATKRVNCSKLQEMDNCKTATYHCIVDSTRMTLVEVCTVPRNLNGRCPLFYQNNSPFVKNDYKRDCTVYSEEDRCATFYSSTDAYKYQACYNITRQSELDSTLTQQTTTELHTVPSKPANVMETELTTEVNITLVQRPTEQKSTHTDHAWAFVFLILPAVIYIICVGCCWKHKSMTFRQALCLGCDVQCNRGSRHTQKDREDTEAHLMQDITDQPMDMKSKEDDPLLVSKSKDADIRNGKSSHDPTGSNIHKVVAEANENTSLSRDAENSTSQLAEMNGSSSQTTKNITSTSQTTENITSSSQTTENITSSSQTTENITSSSQTTENITSSSQTTENITSSSQTTENITSSSQPAENNTLSSQPAENNALSSQNCVSTVDNQSLSQNNGSVVQKGSSTPDDQIPNPEKNIPHNDIFVPPSQNDSTSYTQEPKEISPGTQNMLHALDQQKNGGKNLDNSTDNSKCFEATEENKIIFESHDVENIAPQSSDHPTTILSASSLPKNNASSSPNRSVTEVHQGKQNHNRNNTNSYPQVCSEDSTGVKKDGAVEVDILAEVCNTEQPKATSASSDSPTTISKYMKKKKQGRSRTIPIEYGSQQPDKETSDKDIEYLANGLVKGDKRILDLLDVQYKLEGRIRYLEIKVSSVNSLLCKLEEELSEEVCSLEEMTCKKTIRNRVTYLGSSFRCILKRIEKMQQGPSAEASGETSKPDDNTTKGACGTNWCTRVNFLDDMLHDIEERINRFYEEINGKTGQLKVLLAKLEGLECVVDQVEHDHGVPVSTTSNTREGNTMEMANNAPQRVLKLFERIDNLAQYIWK